MKRAAKPEVTKVSYREGFEKDEGQLQPIAARVLMKILYAARVCRFDLLRAVGVLAQRVTTWDTECDRRLHRLVSYVASHTELCMTGWVGDPISALRPHLFSDADLAGCSQTQRSTTGVLHTIQGPRSSFPIAVVCKRQACVSHSTPEAEITAMNLALRQVGLPAMDVWNIVLPGSKLLVREDNDVAIRVIETGRNPTMRHMSRTHGISVSAIHELFVAGKFEVEYVPSALQAADIFTKSFSVPLQWQSVCRLVNVCAEPDIAHMAGNVGVPFGVRPSADSKHGLWFLRPDGSGAWVRRDRNCSRYRSLRGAGPQRAEITSRHTICSRTRVPLGEAMLDFSTSKHIGEELPPDIPRDVVSVFEFRRTTQKVAEGAIQVPANEPLLPIILSTVFS